MNIFGSWGFVQYVTATGKNTKILACVDIYGPWGFVQYVTGKILACVDIFGTWGFVQYVTGKILACMDKYISLALGDSYTMLRVKY